MNPRQRRGVLLMVLAALGAVFVFITVIGYVGKVQANANAAVGEMATVLQVQSKVEAFQPVTAASVQQTQIPKKWVTDAFVTNIADLQGKVAAGSLPTGAYLQQGMLLDAPSLRPGQREIAILIDAETGVAGKVVPGSIVDVYSSFEETREGNKQLSGACAVRILNRVQVIDVGKIRTETDDKQQGVTNNVVPVTFALNSEETLRLTYAESFATKVRLALVGGARDATPPFNRLCQTPSAGK